MGDSFRFFRAMVRDRRSIGAIAPSGRYLANVVVRTLGPIPPRGIIIELGPGTGSFTKLLVQRHPQARVVAIEIDRQLVNSLRRTIPQAEIIHGCATQIRDHLRSLHLDPKAVAGVVSGLPLLSLPKDLPSRILNEIAEVLPEGRPFVQFTYSRVAWRRFTPRGLKFNRSQLVVSNIPPASVLSFHKCQLQPASSIGRKSKISTIFTKLRRRKNLSHVR